MFQNCIRCTVCVENCPVFAVNPLFPGPKQAGPDAQRFRLDGEATVDNWVKYCSQCRRCQNACPYGVNCADIILRAQMKHEELKLLTRRMFARVHALGRVASFLAPLVNFFSRQRWVLRLLERAGVSTAIPFPPYQFRTLELGWRNISAFLGRREKKVALFYGCFLNFNRPDLGRKIRNLLLYLGYEVVLPPQTCCGLPALGNYDEELARRYAKKNISLLTPYVDAGYDVVYTCTSCGLTLTHDYPGLLNMEGGRKIAENTYYIYDYLLNTLDRDFLASLWGPLDIKVAYHIPCHLKALGIGYPLREILLQIPSLKSFVRDENCCGLSGSYGFKKENEKTSQTIGKLAAETLQNTGAQVIISDCGACRMQLGHLTGLPALDPIEIILSSLLTAGNRLSFYHLLTGAASYRAK